PVVYTVQFKLTVLQFMQRTGSSYPDAAIKFGMKSHSPIIQWKKDFEKGGIEGLNPKRKGRPSMSKKYQSKQKSQDKESSQVERLEHENELLRLEVAYLKKLKAFQENPNVFLEKHKQQWHSNSKKKQQIDPDKEWKGKIYDIFHEHKGRYGYRRIYDELRNQGYMINHKKVQRIMNEMDLRCGKFQRKSRYKSYKGTVGKVAKNRLNRRFNTYIPLQKIVTDVTEFKCSDD